MKKNWKTFVASILCIILVVMLTLPTFAIEQETELTDEVYSDEKVYCDATLEDDFAEDCVIVVLDKDFGGYSDKS